MRAVLFSVFVGSAIAAGATGAALIMDKGSRVWCVVGLAASSLAGGFVIAVQVYLR